MRTFVSLKVCVHSSNNGGIHIWCMLLVFDLFHFPSLLQKIFSLLISSFLFPFLFASIIPWYTYVCTSKKSEVDKRKNSLCNFTLQTEWNDETAVGGESWKQYHISISFMQHFSLPFSYISCVYKLASTKDTTGNAIQIKPWTRKDWKSHTQVRIRVLHKSFLRHPSMTCQMISCSIASALFQGNI